MRCMYTFELVGALRPERLLAFELDDFRFEFGVDKDSEQVRELMVSFPISVNEIATSKASLKGTTNADINLRQPRWERVQEIIRSAEAMWGLWGLQEIRVSEALISYIPESDEESSAITVNHFQVTRSKIPFLDDLPKLQLEYVIVPIITAVKERSHDVRISFYRRGVQDVLNGEYIEAFYDFYFMLESSFGDGKTKNSQIQQKLLQAELLTTAIADTVFSDSYEGGLPSELRSRYQADYANLTSSEFIKKLVKLRGFLHHHNSKRTDGWKPTRQEDFRLEAFMLQDICCRVGVELFFENIQKYEAEEDYKKLIDKHLKGKLPRINLERSNR